MAENPPNRQLVASTKAWLTVYVLLPLVPYLVACGARLLSNPSLCWSNFDVKELAVCLCLTSVFVRESLLDKEILLVNEEKEEEVAGAAAFCWLPAALFFTLFVLGQVFSTLVNQRNYTDLRATLVIVQLTTLLLSAAFLLAFVLIQRSFKLRARI